jgi:alpha,alpha-trehalase
MLLLPHRGVDIMKDTSRTHEVEHENAVDRFIREGWEGTVRRSDPDDPSRVPLPGEFTVPCPDTRFQLLFYWDTFFTNLGLIRHGRGALARSNAEALLAELDAYGLVPNADAHAMRNRSQPPFLSEMVRHVYEAEGNEAWLAGVLPSLAKEYEFWTRSRGTETGLCRYGHGASEDELHGLYTGALTKRLGFDDPDEESRLRVAYHYMAEAESGFDFTPRFLGRCADFVPVDLNSLLYRFEINMAHFQDMAFRSEVPPAEEWRRRARTRKERMDRFLWHEPSGTYRDYDVRAQRHSPILSLASLYPLAFGAAEPKQAARTLAHLPRFQHPYGVPVCPADPTVWPEAPVFQWDYPNVWPPLQYITIRALRATGRHDAARRLAGTYLNTTVKGFLQTGALWEKYDAQTGEPAGGEYAAARMLGWSAGVFVYCREVAATAG